MKTQTYIFSVLFFLLMASSCVRKSGCDDVYGKWKMTQIYFDPGDGSGDFEPIQYEATLIINQDNSVESYNVPLSCPPNIIHFAGTYFPDKSEIHFDGCDWIYSTELNSGHLDVYLPGIEPVIGRFECNE